ncbi:MAG: hypothetical protein KAH13_05860 [Tenericutes bacterium]|nr:hypothetical protein [Mycoplasmatota bacterium]
MIKFITGKINSGKTTRMIQFHNEHPTGDGFISRKIMIGTDVYGFNAVRLSDKFEIPFMIHERYYFENEKISYDDENIKYEYKIGPYHVLSSGIEFIENTYTDIFKRNVSSIFFDEVGKLELNGLGYFKYIDKAIALEKDVYMTAREDLLLDIIEKFSIKKYEIISR